MYERFIKRFLDIVLSLTAIILLSPILLVLAVLVRIKLGSPVIFSQPRPGYHEKIFVMHKFRSMSDARDANGNLLPDDVRLTPFGAKLRDTSLDELPELFNILKGDMSIVGPRPQLVRDIVFMSDEQRKRADVRPGLTGLAQINGRNAIAWDAKLAYDLEYIRKVTFIGDMKIVLGTVRKVFAKEDITMDGMATAMDLGDDLLQKCMITREVYEQKQDEARQLLKKAGLR